MRSKTFLLPGRSSAWWNMKPQTHPWNLKEWIAPAELELGHHEEQAEGDGRIRKWLALADCLLKTDLQ